MTALKHVARYVLLAFKESLKNDNLKTIIITMIRCVPNGTISSQRGFGEVGGVDRSSGQGLQNRCLMIR